jgi:hypothetical protein
LEIVSLRGTMNKSNRLPVIVAVAHVKQSAVRAPVSAQVPKSAADCGEFRGTVIAMYTN